jgi:hypothetical protein
MGNVNDSESSNARYCEGEVAKTRMERMIVSGSLDTHRLLWCCARSQICRFWVEPVQYITNSALSKLKTKLWK